MVKVQRVDLLPPEKHYLHALQINPWLSWTHLLIRIVVHALKSLSLTMDTGQCSLRGAEWPNTITMEKHEFETVWDNNLNFLRTAPRSSAKWTCMHLWENHSISKQGDFWQVLQIWRTILHVHTCYMSLIVNTWLNYSKLI